MKSTLLIIFGLITCFTFSCKHEPYVSSTDENPIDTTTPPPPADTMVCFKTQILPLFQGSCALSGCHDSTTHEEGLILNNYPGIMDEIIAFQPTEGKIMRSILTNDPDKKMPRYPGDPISADELALINRWINQGALNNPNCGNDWDTTNFAYNANIRPLMQTYCNNCHSGNFPSAGISTSTHSALYTIAINGKLRGSVDHQSGYVGMPYQAGLMPSGARTIIRKWVLAGAPNN
jgi:hypothetical protein